MVRRPDLKGEELTAEVVRENVRQAREDLISHSEEIRDLAKGGKVRIAIAVYDIASGRVEWLE
jgi:carbonic anhydrase